MSPSSKSEDEKSCPADTMSAWRIRDYKGIDGLKLEEHLPLPRIYQATDVLVEVRAASVNVLDHRMADGHGKMFFETFLQSRLPLTLGRDFAGVVRAVGVKVHHVKAGDEVMGVVPPHCCTGSHALFVAVPAQFVVLKPAHLSMVEAAALPNAGLVAWTALRTHGQLMAGRGKCVLVIGASGGVGSIVVQLAKTWGSKVVATCSSDAIPLVKSLGADHAIDYRSEDAESKLRSFGGYDLIVDCTLRKDGFDLDLLKSWSNAKYLTLYQPLLDHFDRYGYDVVRGCLTSFYRLITSNVALALRFCSLRWVFVSYCPSALAQLRDYAQNNQLRPVIDSVFPYDRLPEAYAKMKAGHNRGKIVVQMEL